MDKPRNYANFYVLIKKLPYANKEELVDVHTGGRTTSLKEMTCREYESMIRTMRRDIEREEEKRKARSSLLRLMQKYGVDTTDWDEINRFCRYKRIAGKEFGRLDIKELKAVAKKMRAILAKGEEASEEQKHERMCSALLTNYKSKADGLC